MMLPRILHNEENRFGHLTDEDVIERVLNGQKQIFEVVLRRNDQQLYYTIYSILKNADDAKDVLQLTYVKAYEKLYQFKGSSGFGTWLTRIAINEALRKLKKTQQLSDHEIIDSDTFLPEYSSGMNEWSNPENVAIRSELRDILEQAINSLPDKYRTVFKMREMEGYNVEETANSLNLTSVNVKVRLSRAKGILRKLLRKQRLIRELIPQGQYSY